MSFDVPCARASAHARVLACPRQDYTSSHLQAPVTLQASITTGQLLDLGGFNAYGDPVNTAFKLAEDVSEPWDILIDASAIDQCPSDKTAVLGFAPTAHEISNVELRYHATNWKGDAVQRVASQLEIEVIEQQSGLSCLNWDKALQRPPPGGADSGDAAAGDGQLSPRRRGASVNPEAFNHRSVRGVFEHKMETAEGGRGGGEEARPAAHVATATESQVIP